MNFIHNISKILIFSLVALFLYACGSQNDAKTTIDKIKERGTLIVGVKKDAPKFGLINSTTNEYEGLEIDLAKLLAKDILGDEKKLKLEPVTAKTRGPLLDNGTLDIVIATFTITEARKKTYNFSTPYYQDNIGLLVLKEHGWDSFKDLNERVVGVAQAATTRIAIQKAADELGITVAFKEYPDYPSLKSALDSKRIDAFSVDKSILLGYVDANSEILPDSFAPQDYGIASRKDDPSWSSYLDSFITTNKNAIEALVKKNGLGN